MTDATSEAPLPLTGGCMCGAVRYSIAERPLAMALCHCNRCRPQSGSAFSTIIFVHRSAVTVSGKVKQFEDVGDSGMKVLRGSCARCGSPVTTTPDVTPDIMFIKAGGIDNNAWFHPDMELFVGRRRPWLSPVEGVPQFESNPPI